jgi:hypothetical protein
MLIRYIKCFIHTSKLQNFLQYVMVVIYDRKIRGIGSNYKAKENIIYSDDDFTFYFNSRNVCNFIELIISCWRDKVTLFRFLLTESQRGRGKLCSILGRRGVTKFDSPWPVPYAMCVPS